MKANTAWLLGIAGLASDDCRAAESMRWLCYPINQETGQAIDLFRRTLAGIIISIDDLTFANTIHRSQQSVSSHEARAYAATYFLLYSRRGGPR